MSDMKRFDARTQVIAKPMTRQAYNDLRGWELPVDECGNDDGYLTVDINADSNFDGYDGHVSWKPKALFDDQFYEVDPALSADINLDLDSDDTPMGDDEYAARGYYSVRGTSVSGSTRQGLSLDQELMRETIALISPKYADSRTDKMIDDANKVVSAIMGRDSQACDVPDDSDHELTDDEVATLASGRSLCDCCKFVQVGGDCPIEEGDEFDFGSAIHLLKIGKKVARKGWNGAGMYVYYVPAASYPAQRNSKSTMAGEFPDDMVPYREYLALKTAQGDVATWSPSVSDALATDWQLA